MTSLVADLLVNPVLRQARRFSLSRSSLPPDPPDPDSLPRTLRARSSSQQDDVISETEECPSLHYDSGDRTSSRPSSRGSSLTYPQVDAGGVEQTHNHLDNTEMPSGPTTSVPCGVDDHVPNSQTDTSTVNHPDMSSAESPSSPFMQDSLPLPEDDGMGFLRKRILSIQARDIDHLQKAHLIHQLLIEGYTNSRPPIVPEQPMSPSTPKALEKRVSQSYGPLESLRFWQSTLGESKSAGEITLTEKDLEPTFVPEKPPTETTEDVADAEFDNERYLGCEHYRRNVKLQCSTCNRWYTCRFCHDEAEDHTLIRKATRNMLCMLCGTAQQASQACISCEARTARYYCDICKLWNDDPDKPCYHCDDCGICRIGHGIGKDFYHCKKCCACIAISTRSDHRCIERAIDCDCPICGEYMFTSPKPVCFMRCGHSIHRDCLDEHQKTSYKCPICSKSLLNMETQFRNLDLSIQAQPMPPEFRDARAIVLCHDCSAKTSTMYHWLGLKCGVCQSYNTAQLQTIGLDAEAMDTNMAGRSGQMPGLLPPGSIDNAIMDTTARDMRRRHSSIVTRSPLVDVDISTFPPDRLARSVSPVPLPGRSLHASTVRGYFDLGEDEDDGDIFSFWSRIPRSIGSNDEDADAESSDGVTSCEETEYEDGEESEDDDFELLGHR